MDVPSAQNSLFPAGRIAISAISKSWMQSAAISLSAILILSACSEPPAEAPPPVRPVKIFTTGGTGMGGGISYPGSVSPVQDAEIAFEVSGRLAKLPVDEGMDVEKGQLLGQLDLRDFDTALDAQKARLAAARAVYNRTEALYASDAASQQDLDVARRDYDVIKSGVATAEKARDDAFIRAPFAGKIARKLMENFQNVRAKEVVLVLQDESSLEVDVAIPERDWARVQPGLKLKERSAEANVVVKVSTYPDLEIPASLKSYSTTADPVTRTYKVTLSFEPPASVEIRPGMTAEAYVIATGEEKTDTRISVPARAVAADDEEQPYVWVVNPQSMVVNRRPVVTGAMAGESIEIREGLKGGEQIVTSGVYQLRENMAVSRLDN